MLNYDLFFVPDRGPSTVNSDVKVTVTENRAPTDDSIRLATEMREKILNEIIGQGQAFAFDVGGEIFIQQDFLKGGINFGCAYVLNGKRHIFKILIKDHEVWDTNGVETMAEKTMRIFAKAFAENLTGEMLSGFKFDQLGELLRMRK